MLFCNLIFSIGKSWPVDLAMNLASLSLTARLEMVPLGTIASDVAEI